MIMIIMANLVDLLKVEIHVLSPICRIAPLFSTSYLYFLDLKAFVAENAKPTYGGRQMCLICGKELTTSGNNVLRHMKDLHWSGAPSYFCPGPGCERLYSSRDAFRKHKERRHPEWRNRHVDSFIA